MKKYFLLISAFFFSGCAENNYFTPYKLGYLEGNGITIEAIDKSFVITEGEFQPPFQTDMLPISGSSLVSFNPSEDNNLINMSEFALKHGAKRVLIHHPASNKLLYGVLLLNKQYLLATDNNPNSYYIRIPNEYVKATSENKVSVVYETEKHLKSQSFVSWVLWLSETPF